MCGTPAATQNQTFLYDLVGNLSQRQNNNRGLTENVVNDAVDRISASTVNGSATLAMSYTLSGNIQTKTGTSGTWTYGNASKPFQVTQAGSNQYSYDPQNGTMTSRNGYSIYWSSYNYPVQISGPTETFLFAYGPDRQRVRQVSANAQGSETTYYIGGALEKALLGDGTIDYRNTVYAGGQAVALVSRSSTGTNTTRYLIEDHEGSSTTITDSAGAVVVEESFDAFGVPRDPTNWSGAQSAPDQALIAGITRHGYTGHTMLGISGLIHMNGRVMDASIGRFLSPDPYVTDPGNTQNFNRYSYVDNNPLSYTDPSGFAVCRPDDTRNCSHDHNTFNPCDFIACNVPSFPLGYLRVVPAGIALTPGNPTCGPASSYLCNKSTIQTPGAGVDANDANGGLQRDGADWRALDRSSDEYQRAHASFCRTYRPGMFEDNECVIGGVAPLFAMGKALSAARRGSQGVTYLYQKVSDFGKHLKFGVTKDPATRYTVEELAGGRLRILASGIREDMLALERKLHETLPIGLEEAQSIYIKIQKALGLLPPPYP
jgi:RHS repeat-associated protein